MIGFKLEINNKTIKGGIPKGITSIILNYKDGKYHIFFNSLDDDKSMVSYVWYSSELTTGTSINVTLIDLAQDLLPDEIIDYTNQDHLDKRDLATYYKLKKELNSDGLL